MFKLSEKELPVFHIAFYEIRLFFGLKGRYMVWITNIQISSDCMIKHEIKAGF
jgi:hypothetical protein